MAISIQDFSFSTSWASQEAQAKGADWLLARLDRVGLKNLELEYRLTTPLLTQLLPGIRAGGFRVGSVHNFCPLPNDMDLDRASGDLFNLAALDKRESAQAVKHTISTLELASDLEAGAVVLHLGWVAGIEDRQVIHDSALEGLPSPAMAKHLAARAALAPQHLDAVSFSLERLIQRALGLGVTLCLENRFHAFQLPNLDEAALLLDRFQGAPVAYWHDLGHGHAQECAGLPASRAWLERFQGSIQGCHLHDAEGTSDHQPPGRGEIIWEDLSPLIRDIPLKVLEIHPGPGPEEINQSCRFLAGVLDAAGTALGRED